MSNRPRQSRSPGSAFAIVLGVALLVLAGTRIATALGESEPTLEARLAAAPANASLWLELAERDENGKALRLSILTGPREPDFAPRQAALAERLGPRLDDDTRALLK
jgi:hypothetical protein